MKTYHIRYRTILPSGVPKFHAVSRSARNRDEIFNTIMSEHSEEDIFIEKIQEDQGNSTESIRKHWKKNLPTILLGLIIFLTLLPNLV
jgi:hypothetical protein